MKTRNLIIISIKTRKENEGDGTLGVVLVDLSKVKLCGRAGAPRTRNRTSTLQDGYSRMNLERLRIII